MCLCLCPSGIEPQGNTVLQPAHFTVQTADAGVGEVLVYIEDPEGHTEEVRRDYGDRRISVTQEQWEWPGRAASATAVLHHGGHQALWGQERIHQDTPL